MALYFGNQEVNINQGETLCFLNIFSEQLITNGVRMLSSNNLIFVDSDGLYITLKEDE